MRFTQKLICYGLTLAAFTLSSQKVEAVAYVTDTGGYAYDESRAATNLAPAIALGTVAIVAIIAVAVQNSHHSHSHSGSFSHSSGSVATGASNFSFSGSGSSSL